MTEARIPIEFSKGEAAPGQHEVNIRYDEVLESADRSVLFKHGAKEIAYLNGWGHHLHGQAGPHLDRLVGPPPHERLGRRRRERRSCTTRRSRAPYGMSTTMRHFMGGMMKLARELASSSPRTSTRTSASRSRRGRRSTSSGAATTGRPASGSSATDQALHIECRFPGGDMNAYLTYAAFVGAGLYGIRARDRAAGRVQGQRLRRDRLRPDAPGPVRGDPGARASRRPPSRSSARTSSPTTSTRRASSRRPTTRSSIPGIASATSSAPDRRLDGAAAGPRRGRRPSVLIAAGVVRAASSRALTSRSSGRWTCSSPCPMAALGAGAVLFGWRVRSGREPRSRRSARPFLITVTRAVHARASSSRPGRSCARS